MISEIVILAGGLATRLKPLTSKIPKSLIEINGKPFIFHQLDLLRSNGFKKVVLCLGYLGEMIIDSLKNFDIDLKIEYIFDGKKYLGTGGAILNALPLLDDKFFVIYGDSYLDCDYNTISNYFSKTDKLGLMTIFHNENKWDSSNIEYYNGEIISYSKTKKNKNMHYIDYGLSIFKKEAFSGIKKNTTFDLSIVFQKLIANKQLAVFEVTKRFYEIGSFDGITSTSEYIKFKQKI